MQRLPNIIVLDFCEWLRKQVVSMQDAEIDALDFILNDNYHSHLVMSSPLSLPLTKQLLSSEKDSSRKNVDAFSRMYPLWAM